MELVDTSVSARDLLWGAEGFDVAAGKTLKIETSPSGVTILEVEVSEGETWHIQINMQIEKFSV